MANLKCFNDQENEYWAEIKTICKGQHYLVGELRKAYAVQPSIAKITSKFNNLLKMAKNLGWRSDKLQELTEAHQKLFNSFKSNNSISSINKPMPKCFAGNPQEEALWTRISELAYGISMTLTSVLHNLNHRSSKPTLQKQLKKAMLTVTGYDSEKREIKRLFDQLVELYDTRVTLKQTNHSSAVTKNTMNRLVDGDPAKQLIISLQGKVKELLEDPKFGNTFDPINAPIARGIRMTHRHIYQLEGNLENLGLTREQIQEIRPDLQEIRNTHNENLGKDGPKIT